MERGQRPLALRTIAGPVDLRPPRQEKRITTNDATTARTIKKGWLKDTQGDASYQRAVKQAMMIAAEELRLMEAKELVAYSASQEIEEIQERIQRLQAGNARFPIAGTKKKKLQNVVQHRGDKKRETLMKISRKRPCCSRVERSFIIDNGELLVYRDHHPNAKVKAMYQLKDATCFYEDRNSASLPKWTEGYSKRLRVICGEREKQSKSPLFLYSKDDAKIHRWKRAFTLAKVLVSENDRRALKVSIGRAVSGALQKAWDALSTYYGEYAKTKALVKNMAMRLMKVDISRGWMKFKLVYRKREEEKRRRKDQQIWAARFMSEKLTKLGKQKAKEVMDVREGVITRIQQRFRSYREDMIFDRTYPLSSSMMSRVQQAKVGRHLDFAMQTVTADEVCHISLYCDDAKARKAWDTWKKDKDVLRSMTPSYSALYGQLPVQSALVYASDNLSALFFAERSAEAPSAFDKTDWSKFVNMDRISSVILHSDPRAGASVDLSGDCGVWCTINGPRVAWDRQVTDKEYEGPKLRGHADHIKVASEIATGTAKKWVQLTGTVDQVMLQKPKDLQDTEFKTKAVFHLLGYSFESAVKEGSNPTYNLKAEAAVPVASEDFVCLDQSEVGLEIFQVLEEWETTTTETLKQKEQLLYVGSEFLTKIFDVKLKEDGTKDAELCQRLKDYGSVKAKKGEAYKLKLSKPGEKMVTDEIRPKDKTLEQMEEEVTAAVDVIWNKELAKRLTENPCISPELVGGGNTTLYTSNRAAWFDPELGAGIFRPDHVANFVELTLASLSFDPEKPAADKAADVTYYVRASLCGISVSSSALHRSKPAWSQVLPHHLVDPNVIQFEGQRLLVPLPAGCWADAGRRKLKIEVVEVTRQSEAKTLSFEEFSKVAGKDIMNHHKEQVKLKAMLTFDSHMLVDQQKTLGVFLVTPEQEEVQMDVFRNYKDETQRSEGMLSLDFCLRDRDHARATMGQAGQRSSLCVGDKAMLIVEEPFNYPKDASEFRKQFCVGEYSAKKKEWPHPGAPLRDPCLSSEYADSGLGELVPKRPFKQSFIPTFCDDIMPHKYVLPLSEKEFVDKHKAGFWTRIMDDFAKGVARGEARELPYRSGPNKPVVSHLTHMNRHVPVTLLAMYADGTCDLEITDLFIKKWTDQKARKFAFYGKLQVSENGRYILSKVPQILVSAVHYSGINVYDSAFKSTDDLMKAPKPSNAFDPRSEAAQQNKELYEYRLAAGPLPPDASPACCTYEFSVQLRFPNEFEMYHFVAMLRRCVRVDHYQQASKMLEYQKRTSAMATATHRGPIYKSGGQLDVVLVEARRLKPLQSALNTVLQSDPLALYDAWSKGRSEGDPSQSNQMLDPNFLPDLMGTTDGRMPKQTPNGSAIATFVNFRMLHPQEAPLSGEKPSRPEVIPYRGQKVQISSVINGTDSPCWAKESELEGAGGWTFRSGMIGPEKFPRLLLEFEVMQAAISSATRIGLIQIPVTEEQFLTNPEQRFKNLWLPLVNVKDGQQMPNITGEIHVMTRWLPAEMKQVFSDGQEKMQLTTRQMFMKHIWHKVCQKRLREPIYGVEAVYFSRLYEPNVVRLNGQKVRPESFKDNFRRHVEELSNAVPYLECLERRQLNAWNLFKNELQEKGLENRSLGELRLHWQEKDNLEMLNKLQSLILRGVPSAFRPQVWAEVTLASRVSAIDGSGQTRDYADEEELAIAAEKEYQALLARGHELNSYAMHQLQEDSVLLAAWESTSPPLPEAMDLHLKRIKKAKNVVTALLACEEGGVTSSESLLVLAFFLLLPQGYKEASSVSGVGDGLTTPSEASVFWLLYTLICHRYNGMYREYYGQPVKRESDPECLIAGGGAMQDVNLLECCVAYHERDLFFRMSALGFELSTIFYGAFMRWYATFMPTATVFRFWDALLFQSTNPKTQSLGGRDYLIDLAFGALRAKRNELMECESAAEMKSVLLGFLGSLYDTSTVIDLVHSADLYLWGGAGFSSGKVSYLWTQRDEMFKGINRTTKFQNQILHRIAFFGQFRPPTHPSEEMLPGVTTSQLTKEVIPTLRLKLAEGRSGSSRHWAMHRPMPLVARTMLQSSGDKAWSFLSTVTTPDVPKLPFLAEPPKAQAEDGSARKWAGMEPLNVESLELISVIQKYTPGWSSFAPDLWRYFSNIPPEFPLAKRETAVQKMMGGILGASKPDQNVAMTQPKQSAEGTFEQSLSMNEFFGALICCSRGTVAAKAAALFDLYAYMDPKGDEELYHRVPSNYVARTTARPEENPEVPFRIMAPPNPEGADSKRESALRYKAFADMESQGLSTLSSSGGAKTAGPVQLPPPTRTNCIDSMGVRLLVSQVLQRCMMNMSNRQAILVADSLFNRAGVVPGIFQAILAPGTDYRQDRLGLSEIVAKFEERKKPYTDVTREMVFEHERQVSCNGGQVNLFAPSYMYHELNLSTMGVSDPYPDQEKTLYIRFIRGGDGERCTQVSGEIFLSVTWVYPTIEGRGLDVDIETLLKHLEKKHTMVENTLRRFQAEIIDKYETVRKIREQKVTKDGTLKDEFFTELKMTDKKSKDVLKKFFKDACAEDLKARAQQQEQKHSGTLTINIERAERLRRTEVRRLREVDPKALIWVRNDAKQAWHKKPLMQSGRISNDRNPVWNHQETKRLFSGTFEAERKDPPEGWGAKAGQMLSTRKQTRNRQDQQQLAAVRRFGADGLQVFFGKSESETEKLGANHAVHVMLTDSIRDFKGKLTLACASECRHWKNADNSESARKFADVEIGSRHLVMAYVPSKKVQQEWQRYQNQANRFGGAGPDGTTGTVQASSDVQVRQATTAIGKVAEKTMTNWDEFKRQSRLSLQDPSNWQPLDSEKTFAQLATSFGFGQQRVMLKVVEATEGYKAVNPRYKKWVEDKQAPSLQDLNANDKSFGWAKYYHQGDSSSEWRPAIIVKGREDPPRMVRWAYPMVKTAADETKDGEEILAG